MRFFTSASASALCVWMTVTPPLVTAPAAGTALSSRLAAGTGAGVTEAPVSGAGRNSGRTRTTTPATAVIAVATLPTAMRTFCQIAFSSNTR